jgi:hypothetical protein
VHDSYAILYIYPALYRPLSAGHVEELFATIDGFQAKKEGHEKSRALLGVKVIKPPEGNS